MPGNDWAKYVLYADEIRRHGSLLIDNPFWMLGVPFREDPGAPAVYGSYLVIGGQSATVLVHGIWVFAVIAILTTFVVRPLAVGRRRRASWPRCCGRCCRSARTSSAGTGCRTSRR